jgi:hypothetical protein
MRSEQLDIHLRSLRKNSTEAAQGQVRPPDDENEDRSAQEIREPQWGVDASQFGMLGIF